MALRSKTREQIYQLHTYRPGRCDVLPLRGFFHALERLQGHGVKVPDLKVSTFSAQTSTPANVLSSGTGFLYFAWALSPSGASNDAIVKLTDNSKITGAFLVKAKKSGETYFYGGEYGIGIPFASDLKVSANNLTNDGDPSSGDRPDIVVVWGDDTSNTEDANFIVTNYG